MAFFKMLPKGGCESLKVTQDIGIVLNCVGRNHRLHRRRWPTLPRQSSASERVSSLSQEKRLFRVVIEHLAGEPPPVLLRGEIDEVDA